MRRPVTWSLVVLLAACDARINGAPGDFGIGDTSDAGVAVDGSANGPPTTDAALGAWSIATIIPQAAKPGASEDDPTLSSNTLEMIFAIDGGATNGKDLYYTSRASTSAPWTAATKLSFDIATRSEETPRFSTDDKTLYFASDRGTQGNLDIYAVTRAAAGSTTWGTPAQVAGINSAQSEKWYMPCGTHYVMSRATAANGPTDLVEGPLNGAATPIATLNSAQNENGAFLTADCLTIYFSSNRPGPATPSMIYTSHRDTVTAPWQPPTAVTDLKITGGNGNEEDPWLSPDGSTFVFASDAASPGSKDVYISTR